ncbi:MAG: flagellar hook-associated protein FlgK [Bacteriovoracia bacterium]
MGAVNIFNTGKSGLFASRTALATTGHNIANVNTEGYSRQRVETVANDPVYLGQLSLGSGVRINQIHRINDEFLAKQISNEAKYLGQYEEKDVALAQAENIFNEVTNDGLNRLMVRFFNEWRKLGNEPESESLRATVRENAEQLVGDFHRIARSMEDVQKNIDVRIEANVREANELIQRIAGLNQQIKEDELRGSAVADLKDSRDNAVKKLATILDISSATNEKGELTISIRNAGPVISGHLFNKLSTHARKADPAMGVPDGSLDVILDAAANSVVTGKIQNGKLGGLIDARDRIIAEAVQRVDLLAFTFVTKINDIHSSGFSLNNTTGVNFFEQPDVVAGSASNMKVSKAVRYDANNIATAIAPDSPGDNRLVQMIAGLQHQRTMSDGSTTFDDHYNATVATLATETQKNRHVLEHQSSILNQLEKFRESISGVSLDEETTNLIQYQHAFDASAKVIKVADEILDTVLSLKR